MERTLIILKPSCIHRCLIGEVVKRFEKKGLLLVGVKMMQLDDEILNVHYGHLIDKPFFGLLKKSMMSTPVIVQCWEGKEAVHVIRNLIGVTNSREAAQGTIRGDFSMSAQENIVHASDSPEAAEIELKRFFSDNELFTYKKPMALYSPDEV